MKILFVKNNYSKKLKLQKYLDWFKEHTPLSFTTEEVETSFELTTKIVGNDTYKKVAVVGDDIYAKLRSVVPEGKYDVVVFVYGDKLDGVRANVTMNNPLYYGTDLIQLCTTTDNGKKLNHELFHVFFMRLKRQKIDVQDPIDVAIYDGIRYNYFNDADMSLERPSNRTIALELLKPYWKQVAQMQPLGQNATTTQTLPIVTLIRSKGTQKQTTGSITVGSTVFKTLELPDLNNLPNISCIPKGTYTCKYTFSKKFLRFTYEVLNVPKRSGIRIHSANFYYQIQGCIVLGNPLADINADGELDTVNSRIAIEQFETLMGKKPFTLIVK